MGVPNLSTFVSQRKSILFKDNLNLRGSKLLFDGNALSWVLMANVPRRIFAGDYDAFHIHVLDFFGKLKDNDITAYIVMDGGNNVEMKLRTIKTRRNDMIRRVNQLNKKASYDVARLPLPLFGSFYKDAIRESGIPIITCKG